MDLNDSQKYKGRVKMRNLDPKLQGLLGKSVQSGTIEMKDFSPEFQNIITRILNTGSSGAGYNDTELRQKTTVSIPSLYALSIRCTFKP